jgi:hypothetical protein
VQDQDLLMDNIMNITILLSSIAGGSARRIVEQRLEYFNDLLRSSAVGFQVPNLFYY